jgi:hypothetical protein
MMRDPDGAAPLSQCTATRYVKGTLWGILGDVGMTIDQLAP